MLEQGSRLPSAWMYRWDVAHTSILPSPAPPTPPRKKQLPWVSAVLSAPAHPCRGVRLVCRLPMPVICRRRRHGSVAGRRRSSAVLVLIVRRRRFSALVLSGRRSVDIRPSSSSSVVVSSSVVDVDVAVVRSSLVGRRSLAVVRRPLSVVVGRPSSAMVLRQPIDDGVCVPIPACRRQHVCTNCPHAQWPGHLRLDRRRDVLLRLGQGPNHAHLPERDREQRRGGRLTPVTLYWPRPVELCVQRTVRAVALSGVRSPRPPLTQPECKPSPRLPIARGSSALLCRGGDLLTCSTPARSCHLGDACAVRQDSTTTDGASPHPARKAPLRRSAGNVASRPLCDAGAWAGAACGPQPRNRRMGRVPPACVTGARASCGRSARLREGMRRVSSVRSGRPSLVICEVVCWTPDMLCVKW